MLQDYIAATQETVFYDRKVAYSCAVGVDCFTGCDADHIQGVIST